MRQPRSAQPRHAHIDRKAGPRAVSASALALALALPLVGAAPSMAAPAVTAPASPITVPADPADTVQSVSQVTRTAVNVRSGASTNHSIVGSFAEGTELSGSWTDNGWLNLGDGTYVSGSVLIDAGSGETATMYTRTAVNVRSGASTNHSIVGSYSQGTEVSGSWTSNGWLNLGSGRYIAGSVLVEGGGGGGGGEEVTRYARTNVNVRSGPGTDHSIVGSHGQGTELSGTMTSNGWLQTGSSSFVSSSVLTENGGGGGGGGEVSGSDVLEEGRKYFGIMYRGGGASPSTGFDCSGYTQYVFGQLGIDLPRTTGGQRSVATSVSNPQPGDLVFWGSPAYHVAIYAGDGYIYDSGKPGLPVQKRPMFSGVSGFGRVL
ncbi:C40 family peptidase [Ornithinimicrobium faecis]|uniref:NlpC/P60 family protein n=1 Tax=Ornithinimicrobium faecis TaxID=2934158 RepID=A0ABY4YT49_9MICO|nr:MULTISPECIES: C40 family peptidase [unclassified Ornithinimicrobium]USQ79904.1 NlpC/P60 family protein [Ornithinimicrobium sp. HY1793]